ncbi:MAG: hypothetical protein H8E55_21580 [Pelagibacterales bacterium]|nr:hypothetical protein [Pelagibacterales bacterium]
MKKDKKKKKPFGCLTIIIIGIILFIIFSFTVYNLHTSGQKKAFENARPWYVAKDFKRLAMIIKSEEKNCINGSKYLINELLLCDERTPEKIIKALIKTLEINNSIDSSDIPNKKIIVYDNNTYFLDKKTLRISKNNTSDEDVGYISLSASGSDIIIKTCIKKPCNKEANRQSSTVSIK